MGANPTHPGCRHREAPSTEARQAAPEWARLVGSVGQVKFAVLQPARSQSYAELFCSLKFVALLFSTWVGLRSMWGFDKEKFNTVVRANLLDPVPENEFHLSKSSLS